MYHPSSRLRLGKHTRAARKDSSHSLLARATQREPVHQLCACDSKVSLLAGYARVTKGEPAHRENNPSPFQEEALRMLSLVTHWARVDDAELGRPKLSGQEAANPLAVPMMLLYVVDEVCRDDEELRQTYCEDEEWAVQQILKHLQVNRMSLWLVTQSFPAMKDCVTSR